MAAALDYGHGYWDFWKYRGSGKGLEVHEAAYPVTKEFLEIATWAHF